MASKSRRKSPPTTRRTQAFCGIDIYTGHQTFTPDRLFDLEEPREIKKAFEQAWNWYQKQWFVHETVDRQVDFFNFEFAIVPKENGAREEVREWVDDREEELLRYAECAWRDRLVYQNVISFWRQRDGATLTPAMTLAPEQCEYSDAMGVEKLRFRPPWKLHELSDDLKRRYKGDMIELDKAFGEFFRVQSDARPGYGFAWPKLCTVFRTLSQGDSMEVGESLLAWFCRSPVRQHALGHEITSGPRAGLKTHFMAEARARAVEKEFKNAAGAKEIVTNFDHKVAYHWPDPKSFTGDKWETLIKRLMVWAGPMGRLLTSPTLEPGHLLLLKHQAIRERRRMGLHFAAVFNEAFDPPAPVKVQWSNRCFNEPRTALELLNAGLTAGPLSQSTWLTDAGFDPGKEKELKRIEAAEDAKLHLPIYDKDHGQEPGKAPSSGGRPAGKGDPD